MEPRPYTPRVGSGLHFVQLSRSDLARIHAMMRSSLPEGGRVIIRTDNATMDTMRDLDRLHLVSLARLQMVRQAPGQSEVRLKVGRLGADVEADANPDLTAMQIADGVDRVLSDREDRIPWHLRLWLGLVAVSALVSTTLLARMLDVDGWLRLVLLLLAVVLLIALLTVVPTFMLAPHQIHLTPRRSWYERRALIRIAALVPLTTLVVVVLFALVT